MKKIIVFNMVTVDGFFAGEDGNINWHNVDAEFNEFAIKQLHEIDTLIFGRVTYDLMAGYWPTEGPVKDDPIVAGLMNNASKIVFSKTLETAEWNNTKVMKEINKEEIEKLKEISDPSKAEAGGDIFIFGSGQIVQEFAKLGLIDEYRVIINPVALGKGKPLFAEKLKLKLIKSKEFKSGNILLYYRVN